MKRVFILSGMLALTLFLASCETRVFGTEIGFKSPAKTAVITVAAAGGLTPTSQGLALAPAASATAPTATGVVCFGENIESGNLRVRECPGLTCSQVGLLAAGAQVATTGERKDGKDGSAWLHLAAPVEGWVNSRYICQPEVE
ncbi:MAG: SH3 domain-containing protein [Anaerolineales bacterium]|jgi:hypothetical protein|nr:SH3 domain-containing protein [Anaerolineales bacterium]